MLYMRMLAKNLTMTVKNQKTRMFHGCPAAGAKISFVRLDYAQGTLCRTRPECGRKTGDLTAVVRWVVAYNRIKLTRHNSERVCVRQ